MKTFTKALVGTVAAGAMAVSAASPAAARDRGNGIDAGDVVAGALIIGGIAAIASVASKNDRGDRYDANYAYGRAGYGGYQNARYGYGNDNPRQAVAQCVAAAEQGANRYSYGGRADVTDVRSVRQTRNGYEVKGRIAVNTMGRGWGRQDASYGRGWNGDYRGWNSNLRGYDSGSFTCRTDYGRVADVDYNGIRGL